MSLFSHELAEEDTKVLAGAIYFIGLKTLEQVDTSILPERKLGQISELVRASEEQVIETSRKVL